MFPEEIENLYISSKKAYLWVSFSFIIIENLDLSNIKASIKKIQKNIQINGDNYLGKRKSKKIHLG